MKINEIINSVYVLPMVLDALEEKRIGLPEIGIDAWDLEELSKVKRLLEYHLGVVQSGFKPDYPRLRAGLDEYFEAFLTSIFDMAYVNNFQGKFLDYGAGDGAYSRLMARQNPEAEIHELERDRGMMIDFEKTPEWYVSYLEFFDLVLISELLHCKESLGQEYIVTTAREVLKTGGKIIINENEDPYMNYRLKKITGKKVGMLTATEIFPLMHNHGFNLLDTFRINYHKIYVYEKV